jgi:membrane-associated protease RseP (regulator of RpoE activity)
MIFWLILLGIFTYVIVQRSVASITRTPVWILWAVMMTPAFIWTGWVLLNGESAPPPPVLVFVPFIVCPILYWFLIQWGRPAKPASAEGQSEPADAMPVVAEKRPVLRPIDKQEESALQNCFPWTVYYLQNIEYRPQALICRGQLRAAPEVAYKTVQENVESHFGDRFLVVFQEGLNGKPFFALVPNPHLQTVSKANGETVTRPGLALALVLATLFTTTLAGAAIAGISEDDLSGNFSQLAIGLPYAIAIMAILGVHELAHYLAARFYRIKATLPYFIPIPPAGFFPFGTLGAFIQMRSPVPNRKALFDVGLAGPLAGFVVALPLFIWGLYQSTLISATEESGILNFASLKPTLLLPALLSKLAFGSELTANSAIQLHPVAVAGYLGILVTAINLIPLGQLDGGHIVHAMFGQRAGAIIGQVARFLVLALSLVQQELLLWAILLFFIPVVDEPALNDVSELDNRRDLVGLLSLGLLVMIILPTPQVITQALF